MRRQTSVGLYHQGCTEELVVGLHSQQGTAAMVNVLASDLDTAVVHLVVYWLDNSAPALDQACQAGSVLQEHCEVDSKAGAVSRLDTDVEQAVLALELSALMATTDW